MGGGGGGGGTPFLSEVRPTFLPTGLRGFGGEAASTHSVGQKLWYMVR